MKRLAKILLGMDSATSAFGEMYEGPIKIYPSDNSPPYEDGDARYYKAEVGYLFERSGKTKQDMPTLTISIPLDKIIKEDEYLKRLKYYLLSMQPDTSTYAEMYTGETIVHFPPKSDGSLLEPEAQCDPVYRSNGVGYKISRTNKNAADCPTIDISIPADRLFTQGLSAAAADYCLRSFSPYIDALNADLYNRSRPDRENGKYYLYRPGGEILLRNATYFSLCPQKDYENGGGNSVYLLKYDTPLPPQMCLCIKLQVQLPAKKIRKTIQMLCRDLPDAVDAFIAGFDGEGLKKALELSEKQAAIRRWLKGSDFCAFISNGSILPRAKDGESPLIGAVPFKSAAEDEITVCGVTGMAIKKGVTVITGGGYSGKSTLLDAISAGIYDHAPGDGRELVITDQSAVDISAEDGRSVKNADISPFIKWIPGGDPRDFSTEHASGSTSQAANIAEAVNAGAKLLLVDEDRSATNFMIRDRMMKRLIRREPITPFTDRVNELYDKCGVSSILVIGGSGEYLSAADRVYIMEEYKISDATAAAKEIARQNGASPFLPEQAEWKYRRTLLPSGFTSYPEGSGTERLEVSDMGFIIIGDERVDIRMLHNVVSQAQLDALGFILRYLEVSGCGGDYNLEAAIDGLYEKVEKEGLDCVFSSFFTVCRRFLALPRKYELKALINRMRNINFTRSDKT